MAYRTSMAQTGTDIVGAGNPVPIPARGGIMNNAMQPKCLTMALALALGGAIGISAESQSTLKVGDPAPKLQTGKWIQGEPVTGFEKGKAYIVEFWATWCGPCRESIPHLNETYTKYKDKGLIVIGQNCWERDDALVAPFVKKMGDKMTYRVPLDDKKSDEKGAMATTWMAAARQNGIPTAFIIDTHGKIAWIGHPMAMEEKVLDDVLADKYDVEKAAKTYSEEKKKEWQLSEAQDEIQKAMEEKKWDVAMAKVDDMEKLLPEEHRTGLDGMRMNILFEKKDYPSAYKMAQKLSDANKSNSMVQNQLAWEIATSPGIEERNLELAASFAERGNDASEGKNADVLDTMARIQFMQGKHDEAIKTQEKAVSLAQGQGKQTMEKTLDSYKDGKLPKVE
jgi:thiol-disulfide isomerase/thioredoxin